METAFTARGGYFGNRVPHDLVDVVLRANIFGDDELPRLCGPVKEKIAGVEPDPVLAESFSSRTFPVRGSVTPNLRAVDFQSSVVLAAAPLSCLWA